MGSAFEDHPFFRQNKLKDLALVDTVTRMELLELRQGERVFEYGTEGDLFYLVLKGAVEVRIPDPNQKAGFQSTVSQIEHCTETISQLEDQITQLTKHGARLEDQLKMILKRNLDAQGIVLINPHGKESEIQGNLRRIDKFKSELVGKRAELKHLEEVKNQEMMVPVVRLGKGKWFVELALRVTSSDD